METLFRPDRRGRQSTELMRRLLCTPVIVCEGLFMLAEATAFPAILRQLFWSCRSADHGQQDCTLDSS